jgi:hypothetical protein
VRAGAKLSVSLLGSGAENPWMRMTVQFLRSGLKTHVDGVCNLLSSLGYGRFRHGVAESSSVVRPGIKTHVWAV